MTSCRDFIPPSPFPIQGDFGSQYLSSVSENVQDSGYLQTSGGHDRWRLTAHITARFAWMMVALLGSALIGELILLPALLLSQPGRHEKSKPEAGFDLQ